MKLIKPTFEIVEQKSGLDGLYKQIELAGRTCYHSQDRITEDSAKKFVDMMINSQHLAMLEHGTVYLKIPVNIDVAANYLDAIPIWTKCKLVIDKDKGNWWAITTNLRVLIENDLIDDLQYLCEPTEYHEKRYCVRFTSDIHFYKDLTRHRVMSWAIESTRFCNYIKQKFGFSVAFVTPIWLKEEEQEEFEKDLETIESIYFKWINKGWKPEQAAYFLIQGTKAEIFMTGFASDFNHFFDLRSAIAKTGKPHPTVVELIEPLRQEFIKRGYINND